MLLLAQLPGGASITIFSLALSDIAKDLDTTVKALSWAVTGAILGAAVGGSIGGKFGDIYGHKRVYLASIAVLGLATGASALAWSGPALIVFRVVGGIAAGGAQATSSAMILGAFPAHARHRALGWHQSAMTMAPALGLLAGGPLIDGIGWRPLLWAFVGLTAIGFVSSSVVVRASARVARYRVDFLGAALLAAAVVGLLLFFDRGKVYGFSHGRALVWLVFGLLSTLVFVVVEARVSRP